MSTDDFKPKKDNPVDKTDKSPSLFVKLFLKIKKPLFKWVFLMTIVMVVILLLWNYQLKVKHNSQELFLPEFDIADTNSYFNYGGIKREAQPNTEIPPRPRTEVIFYQVQEGDNIFSIAESFGLEPETIVWNNSEIFLIDTPEIILTILPVDGIYHRYGAGESLNIIASYFGVEVAAIVDYPENHLDPFAIDPNNPGIADGTWLIIPGGEEPDHFDFEYFGTNQCAEDNIGPTSTGTFIWLAESSKISDDYPGPGIFEAIDIVGIEGSPIFASDNGFVKYLGPSDFGYGNVIVIDHGNGWLTAYAHLKEIFVECGQAVYQGETIGTMGTTGNSNAPHLHFELMHSSYGNVNPLDYLIERP